MLDWESEKWTWHEKDIFIEITAWKFDQKWQGVVILLATRLSPQTVEKVTKHQFVQKWGQTGKEPAQFGAHKWSGFIDIFCLLKVNPSGKITKVAFFFVCEHSIWFKNILGWYLYQNVKPNHNFRLVQYPGTL